MGASLHQNCGNSSPPLSVQRCPTSCWKPLFPVFLAGAEEGDLPPCSSFSTFVPYCSIIHRSSTAATDIAPRGEARETAGAGETRRGGAGYVHHRSGQKR